MAFISIIFRYIVAVVLVSWWIQKVRTARPAHLSTACSFFFQLIVFTLVETGNPLPLSGHLFIITTYRDKKKKKKNMYTAVTCASGHIPRLQARRNISVIILFNSTIPGSIECIGLYSYQTCLQARWQRARAKQFFSGSGGYMSRFLTKGQASSLTIG
jgi:hypothetical protein